MPIQLCGWCDDVPRPSVVTWDTKGGKLHLCKGCNQKKLREVNERSRTPKRNPFLEGFNQSAEATA